MISEEISCLLPDGTIGPIALKNCLGSSIFILFYPGDFLTLSREEVKELTNLYQEFSGIQCHVFACSTATSQMHQSWMSTKPTEDYEGLGFRPPFPLLGDPNKKFCKSFDMFNEERDCAKHGFILLNESGYVKYKEIIDQEAKLNLDEALATVKRNILFAEIKEKVTSKKSFDSDTESDLPEPPPLPNEPPPPLPTEPPPMEYLNSTPADVNGKDDSDSSSDESPIEKTHTNGEEHKDSDQQHNQTEIKETSEDGHKEKDPKKEVTNQDSIEVEMVHELKKEASRERIAVIETIEDELEELEEHSPAPSIKETQNNTQALTDGSTTVSEASTVIRVGKSVSIVETHKISINSHVIGVDNVDSVPVTSVPDTLDAKSHPVLKSRLSVKDMEESLKRELSEKRKEEAGPPPIQTVPQPAQAAKKAPEKAKKAKNKDDDSCCVIS